ncbi:serine/arginine repetitive matrix protein 4 isoform X2 [Stigmatopora argus]
MQTANSVQLTLESQEKSAAMLHQKQLFEKFWKGTFKAVAMPRPESVIVASIIARARVTRPAAKTDQTPGDNHIDKILEDSKTGDVAHINQRKGSAVDSIVKPVGRKKHHRHGRRHHRRHRHCRAISVSLDERSSPWPKGKKKKRKLSRKRQRRRSHSCSLSPLKKKKKKKKSTKKSKRHRYSHKKSKRGSSSTLKHERKNERKRKKSSGTRSRRKRHRRRSTSDCLDRHSACKNRSRDMLDTKRTTGSVSKLVKKTSVLTSSSTYSSKLFQRRASQQVDRSHDCDSGNDTSSPPSSKRSTANRSDVLQRRHTSFPLADKDGVSDSGNSLTSYASFGKPHDEDSLNAASLLKREHEALKGSRYSVEKSPLKSSKGQMSSKWPHRHRRSRSSGNSRHLGRHSSSPSLSSASCSSRSPSYSPDLKWRRGSLSSLSSRGSYSRYRYRRLQTRTSSSSETDAEHKVSRKRRRYKSYSPMRKRRRNSPSYLEARRITSARKRPVPYFRRSSPCSRRSTSVTSWSSLFSRCRPGSPAPSSSSSSLFGSFIRG